MRTWSRSGAFARIMMHSLVDRHRVRRAVVELRPLRRRVPRDLLGVLQRSRHSTDTPWSKRPRGWLWPGPGHPSRSPDPRPRRPASAPGLVDRGSTSTDTTLDSSRAGRPPNEPERHRPASRSPATPRSPAASPAAGLAPRELPPRPARPAGVLRSTAGRGALGSRGPGRTTRSSGRRRERGRSPRTTTAATPWRRRAVRTPA